ncbi:hypothetical protein HaLaN_17678 [Haematococcus lacustris]|uniref:Uncharacterized protein n=1 Tax=Haematococcus lacustris TaxID=44745 RepID=A0A699ZLR7_HAELA|nr:hypothetical protein HaLaN_17678 [Haematococcus lacustris]
MMSVSAKARSSNRSIKRPVTPAQGAAGPSGSGQQENEGQGQGEQEVIAERRQWWHRSTSA